MRLKHIKNYSLLYSNDMRSICMAPAYDIVCTRAYPGPEEMSFYIGGELNFNKIGRENFELAARGTTLSAKMAMKHFDDIASKYEKAVEQAYDELMQQGISGIEFIKKAMLEKGGYGQICY